MKVFRFMGLFGRGAIFCACTLFGVLGITGCSRKVVPVSSIDHSKQTTVDSTNSRQSTVDISTHIETLTEKKIPEASVNKSFRQSQWDSLIMALKTMPANTPVIFQDKKVQAQLQILMDSLGNIQLKCTSLEKVYWEKNIQQSHFIQSLLNEVSKLRHEKSSVKEELREAQKTWWARITENLLAKSMIYFILGGLTIILIRIGLKKIPFIKNYIP